MHHPHHPPRQPGYLMQKILACEQRFLPCHSDEICLSDCRSSSICSVTAAGPASGCLCENRLQLNLPVVVSARDACGHYRTVCHTLAVETDAPACMRCAGDAHTTILALPCIRLLRSDLSGGGCFRIQLQIHLDILLLRYETAYPAGCAPACPQLPLYPPPIC